MCLHDQQLVHHKYFHEDYGNDFRTPQVHCIHYCQSDRHLQLVVPDLDEKIEHMLMGAIDRSLLFRIPSLLSPFIG